MLKLPQSIREFEQLAVRVRRRVLDVTAATKSAHLASCFSCVDLLVALYFRVLRHAPENVRNPERDRMVLSKGHACLSLYTVLAERGFISEELYAGYGIDGGTLEHHTKRRPEWGIEVSAGSLGHGLSLGAGMAKAAKLDDMAYRTFVLLSDGELNEGSIWEAVMFAAHHQLDNLVAIVDYNKIQALGRVEEVMKQEPLVERWRAFGWNAVEIDGHDFDQIFAALEHVPRSSGKPTAIIAHTVKGKGVSFMEDRLLWHYRCPDKDELLRAQAELEPAV